MIVSTSSTIAELRSELERKRNQAQELQMNTTDPDEWAGMNTLRWELEDLDKDLYLNQFIKNNDRLEKLIGQIKSASADAQKLVETIAGVEQAVNDARGKLKSTSSMFDEMARFLDDIDRMIKVIKA